MLDRAQIVHETFIKNVTEKIFPIARSETDLKSSGLSEEQLKQLYRAQMLSRHLDCLARRLKAENLAYYTIGSSGHEGNAAIAEAFRSSDLAFLHYRSAAFFIQRLNQCPGTEPVYDIIKSLVAAKSDPISSGRHKVFGSSVAAIPPQTSTIASHLPKAVGAALSITRAKELKLKARYPQDSVVLVSFGDASFNHASAQTALNESCWIADQSYPLPIVFICEDNGWGISVPTPKRWIKDAVSKRSQIHYLAVDGLNICDVYRGAKSAESMTRHRHKPVFLHMHCVRLLGHAGSDIESLYRTDADILETEANDPLLHTARICIDESVMDHQDILNEYEAIGVEVAMLAERALKEPKLQTSSEIMADILPRPSQSPERLPPVTPLREACFGAQWQHLTKPRNMAQQLNHALTDLMLQYETILLFGEDVAKKGGVYHVTADLQKRFGQRRVFDTLLDETTILGTAIGLAHNGFLPMPEIQFLAYFHNAEDQLRGEAATLSFFSNGQFTNPMVVRIPSMAYQKGFGGHFHNDNSIAAIRDIPGVIIALPSNGEDAAKMLRECVYQAYYHQRIVVFLEPIALYMTKDLFEPGDNLYLSSYSDPNDRINLGDVKIYGEGKQCVILTFGNGTYLSRQAQRRLKQEYDIECSIVDLRWLQPLPIQQIESAIADAECLLIVDECRKTGGLSEGIITALIDLDIELPKIKRLTALDSFIPLGEAWQYVLPSVDDIILSVRQVMGKIEE